MSLRHKGLSHRPVNTIIYVLQYGFPSGQSRVSVVSSAARTKWYQIPVQAVQPPHLPVQAIPSMPGIWWPGRGKASQTWDTSVAKGKWDGGDMADARKKRYFLQTGYWGIAAMFIMYIAYQKISNECIYIIVYMQENMVFVTFNC